MPQMPYRFPGIQPFSHAERGQFFGRKEEIKALLKLIHLRSHVTLYGKSGLGKSSLIQAGLIPLLQQEDFIPIQVRFEHFQAESDSLPLDKLLAKIPSSEQHPAFLSQLEAEDSLWLMCKKLQLQAWQKSGRFPVLFFIFDQFEELFSYPQGVQDFATALADLVNDTKPETLTEQIEQLLMGEIQAISDDELELLEAPLQVKILFSTRADQVSLLDRLSKSFPSILRYRYELLPLVRSHAEEAIVKPAALEGDFQSIPFSFNPAALSHILDYLTQKDRNAVEPFQLQIICQALEDFVIEKQATSTWTTYSVSLSNLPDFDHLFETYYENALEKIKAPAQQEKARHMLEEGLILEVEKRRLTVDGGQLIHTFKIEPEILKALVNARLLRSEPNSKGGTSFEITHDTLIAPILEAKRKREEVERLKRQEEQLQQEWEERRKKQRRRLISGLGALGILGILLFVILSFRETRGLNQALKMLAYGQSFEQQDPTLALGIGLKALEKKESPIIEYALADVYAAHTLYSERFLADGPIEAMAIRDDGQRIAISGEGLVENLPEVKAILMDAKGENQIYLKQRNNIQSICYLPSSGQIVTADVRGGALKRWDAEGKMIQETSVGNAKIFALDVDPSTGNVAVSTGKRIIVWDWQKDSLILDVAVDASVYTLRFSPDRSMMAIGDRLGEIQFMDMTGGSSLSSVNMASFITALDFSKGGDSLLVGLLDQTLALLVRIGDSLTLSQRYIGHSEAITSASFGVDDQYILSTSRDKTLKIWDWEASCQHTLLGHRDQVATGSWNQASDGILSGSKDGRLLNWEINALIRSKSLPVSIDNPFQLTPMNMRLSADRRSKMLLAGGLNDRQLFLWESDEERPQMIEIAQASPSAIAWATGERHLWIGLDNGVLMRINRQSGKEKRFLSHQEKIRAIAVSDRLEQLVTASDDSTLVIWDAKGTALTTIRSHHGPVSCLDIGQETGMILSGSQDSTIRIWDQNGMPLDVFRGHEGAITALAIAHDESYIVSGSDDQTFRIWSPQGELLYIHTEAEATITAISISPDNQRIAIGFQDGHIQLIDRQGHAITRYANHSSAIGNLAFSTSGEELYASTIYQVWTWETKLSFAQMRQGGLAIPIAAKHTEILQELSR